jgi:tetratricopeptide (TPR) repeat protein
MTLCLTAKETALTDSGIRPIGRSLYSLENLIDQILALFQEPVDGDLATRKAVAVELLSAWHTLLVLDNMETVSDGRIHSFVQSLPPANRAKVLLTSRQKTGAWELPLPVSELNTDEIAEFVRVRSSELGVDFPLDAHTLQRVEVVSGGLPLAIHWLIGQYRATRNLDRVFAKVREKDSPVLEFSFRNIWNLLGGEARTLLAVLTIFDGPTTAPQLGIATEMPAENIERALSELVDYTLVMRSTQQSDGRVLYSALPITLTFARHQLGTMGDLETRCRRRLNMFDQQMELQEAEISRFRSTFDRYGLRSDNERKAAILCRRAESEVFAGNYDQAKELLQQARDLAPQSAYVHAMSASYELTRKRLGAALDHISEACRRATATTGSLCYTIKAHIFDEQRDRAETVRAFAKALEYDPGDVILRHQYGVALSRAGQTQEAIDEFTAIIEAERVKKPPRETLVMALTTRIMNLRRLGRETEAIEDIALARRILEANPALQRSAIRLNELIDEGNESVGP